MSEDAIKWLLEVQIYQRDWQQTLIAVMERIQAGEVVTFACGGCGDRLGVYSVYVKVTHCQNCEQAASVRPAAQVCAA